MRVRMMLVSGLIALAGCQANQSSRDDSAKRYSFQNEKYMVGGGFGIEYIAPADGTLIYIDEARQQILTTNSVTKGERFSSSADPADEGARGVLGDDWSMARLVLYFVPGTIAAPIEDATTQP